MFLDRPGLDRARELIEAGEVAVAQDADRITRKAAHRLTLDENGLMRRRDASINDCGIDESGRRFLEDEPYSSARLSPVKSGPGG